MIFKKLTLKNFMSYSGAELDLSGIHVACLSGANGAGKSTLLDAITWALWEEGRARTDELIRLGQDEMSCEVDFFMEDNLYKIYRSRTKSFKNSQGKSNLEFQVFNPKEQIWISLSKSATRQTQELIIKTIKMDYNTFVNSVYLRQGKADEFTLKKPTDRKQILADIVGLEAYDKLCDASKEKLRFIDQSIFQEQSLISSLKEKIEKENDIQTRLLDVRNILEQEEIKLKDKKDHLMLKEKELNEKKEKEKQILALERSKETQGSLIKTLEEQLHNTKNKIEKYNQLIIKKEHIEKEYKEYLNLKQEQNLLEEKREKHETLSQKKNILEVKIKEKISEVEKQLAVYKSQINDRNNFKTELTRKMQNENKFFNEFLPKVEEEIKIYHSTKEALMNTEAEGQSLKYEKDLLVTNLKQVKDKKDEMDSKIKTLNQHNHSESCPLCKGPIQDKNKIIELYKTDIENLTSEEILIQKQIGQKEIELTTKRDEYNKLKNTINSFGLGLSKYLEELESIKQENLTLKYSEKEDSAKILSLFESQIEVSKNEFQKTKEKLIVLDHEITNCNQDIKSLNSVLMSGEHVKEISGELNIITQEINALQFNSKLLSEIKIKINDKENIVLIVNSLTQAESEISSLRNEFDNVSLKVQQGQNELSNLANLINENKKQILNIHQIQKEVSEIKETILKNELILNEKKKESIILEEKLKDIEDSRTLLNEKEKSIQIFLNDKKYFEILEKAFSKNGIQVAIIETIVPEIEKEANRILNRLTDNQMHIALKTQKERKSSSGLMETLEVVIADSVGTRNYELYSGGEAFKINFALRLALSRLLVNRAGAKLQTLIIDEGFGSQDNAGKERLLEVIKSIQDEFELILVVTHIDELKEAFPVQIHVAKDDNGSKVTIAA